MGYIDYNDNESIVELDGFAECVEDVDGNFVAFNRSLATQYINAMIDEDFFKLGEVSYDLLCTLTIWNNDSNISDLAILDGSLKTCKNRTFIEAIIDNHAYKVGDAYINNIYNDIDPKLIAMMIECSDEYRYYLRNELYPLLDEEEWFKLIQDVFDELNIIYLAADQEKQQELLIRVKNVLPNITVSKKYKTKTYKLKPNEFIKKVMQ